MGRNISDEHIQAYKEGCFKKLLEAIKEDPELSFEVRLNNAVMVYYHKDKILTTAFSGKGQPKVTMLDAKYYNPDKTDKKPPIDMKDEANWKSLTKWRTYFNQAKELVYFYKKGTEFTVQQNIALGNQSYKNRYLVVDMEWQFAQSDVKDRVPRTRFDLVIIDTVPNEQGVNDIYLAELKVGTVATEGTSGTIAHVKKTNDIINKEKACQALKEDVQNIIRVKNALAIYEGTPKDLLLADKPKMMLILAYRGKKELEALEKDRDAAQAKAKELGMEEIKVIMHNALIQLK